MENYDYPRELWDYVLPDGTSFCHWGGRDISYSVLELLSLKKGEKVCDICCGEAGTLALIRNPSVESYGLDISRKALREASKMLRENVNLIQTDINRLPFGADFFDKVFAQDPDVFLHPDKFEVMHEISRVICQKGKFVLQTYCTMPHLNERDKEKTDRMLRESGYPYTDVIGIEEVVDLIRKSGFDIQSFQDLYYIYASDNLRMIDNLERNWPIIMEIDEQQGRNLRRLLEWERNLFLGRKWTGILLRAEKQ